MSSGPPTNYTGPRGGNEGAGRRRMPLYVEDRRGHRPKGGRRTKYGEVSWNGTLGVSRGPHMRDDAGQDLVQVHPRLIPDERPGLPDVRDPAPEVFEPGLVGLVVRDADDGGGAVGHRLHP